MTGYIDRQVRSGSRGTIALAVSISAVLHGESGGFVSTQENDVNSNLKANAWSFFAGVLTVNSLAHLATAIAQKEHLTPLAGRQSGPVVNAIWGAMNLSGGLAIARVFRTPGARWGQEKHAFGAGVAVFGAWMLFSELMWRTNCA